MGEIAYTLFLSMLNMVDYKSLQLDQEGLLYLIHVVYTFVVSIMLINFFVAVMSDAMAGNNHRDHLANYIQRSTAAHVLEGRLRWMLRVPYYKRMSRKVFTMKEQGRIVLLHAEKA